MKYLDKPNHILNIHEIVKTIGAFRIETSFDVSGRGIIVVGQIMDAIPKTGKFISIEISGKKEVFKITGIECGNPDENNIIRYGLLLSINDSVQFKFISDNKLDEQIADILED